MNCAFLSFCNGGHFCCVLFHSAKQNKENWLLIDILDYKQLPTYMNNNTSHSSEKWSTLIWEILKKADVIWILNLLGRLSSQVKISAILLTVSYFLFCFSYFHGQDKHYSVHCSVCTKKFITLKMQGQFCFKNFLGKNGISK